MIQNVSLVKGRYSALTTKKINSHYFIIAGGVLLAFLATIVLEPSQLLFFMALVIISFLLLRLVLDFKTTCYFVIFLSTVIRLQFEYPNPLMQPSIFMMIIGFISALMFFILKKGKLYIPLESIGFGVLISYTLLISYYKSPVWNHSLDGIIQLILAFLGFIVITQTRNFDKVTLFRMTKFVIFVGLAQTIYGLISLSLYSAFDINIGGLMFNQFGTSVTVQGTMFEANLFGSFVGVCLLILITMLLTGHICKHYVFWYLSAILLFTGLVLSWTRSAWIGFALGVLYIVFIYIKKVLNPKTIFLLFSLLLIVVPILFTIQTEFDRMSGESGLFTSKLTNIFDNDSGTGKYRTEQYKFALYDLRGDELTGKGYYSIKQYGEEEWISNIFIFFYHDTGLIGLTILILVLISAFYKAFRAIYLSNGNDKLYMVGLTSGLILLIFSYNFTPGHVLSVFWVYLGLVVTLSSMIINSHKNKTAL